MNVCETERESRGCKNKQGPRDLRFPWSKTPFVPFGRRVFQKFTVQKHKTQEKKKLF